MHFEVERLTSDPRPFAYEEGPEWWSARTPTQAGLPRTLAEALAARGVGYKSGAGEEIVLEGEVETGFELECARCLGSFRQHIHEDFRLLLEPAGTRTPADPEAAAALERDGLCLGDELELGWYRGSEIQLDALCLEIVSLALPVKALCREDCAGLCPRCGVDRNRAPCSCEEVAANSPFAVLAALRDGLNQGAK